MAEVLGGDYPGNRILRVCELVRDGFVPKALVTGGGRFFGVHESILAIDFAGQRGCPADFFIPVMYPAQSTTDEVVHLLPELRRRGVHKLLVVTSPSHTGRAARVFRRQAPDIEVHMIAARDPNWNNGYWWKLREGRKTWFFEMTKTIADFFGI
ncbi:MAG: YdcF family protein [Acidobacteriota bacterium]